MARRRGTDTRPTVGSLFSGYGGLDLAAEAVFGARTAWHVENDPHASKILAAHWPIIPNHGDITAVDWAQVEPVDILCGGFPCQDISSAGLGAGIIEGTRSGLWFRYADAIRVLRPRLVVVENVGMLLRRGMGVVLGDLADLGYDARWASVRASDVGAPHRRQRVFIVAHAGGIGRFGRQGVEGVGRDAAQRGEASGHLGDGAPPPADTDLVAGRSAGEAEPRDGQTANGGRGPAWARRRGGPTADPHNGSHDRQRSRSESRPGDLTAPDADGERHGRGQEPRMVGRLDRPDEVGIGQWERPRQVAGDRSETATLDPYEHGLDRLTGTPLRRNPLRSDLGYDTDRRRLVDWGQYAQAIHRWETLIGQPAPEPTDGKGRLSAPFVEWMMGLPAGWVTDVVARHPALRCLGNGVVLQQAEYAIKSLHLGV